MQYPLLLPAKLAPSTESWVTENADRSGGVSLTGVEQVVSTGSSRWRAKLTWSSIFGDRKVLLRGYLLGLRGRSGTMVLGPSDRTGLPWGADQYGRVLSVANVGRPQLAGTPFADAPDLGETLLARTVLNAAARGDHAITVRRSAGADAQIGNVIGVGQRMHIVTWIDVIDPATSTYSIEPGLRADTAAGAVLIMTKPVCTMRLAAPVGDLATNADRAMDVSVEFVEAF